MWKGFGQEYEERPENDNRVGGNDLLGLGKSHIYVFPVLGWAEKWSHFPCFLGLYMSDCNSANLQTRKQVLEDWICFVSWRRAQMALFLDLQVGFYLYIHTWCNKYHLAIFMYYIKMMLEDLFLFHSNCISN